MSQQPADKPETIHPALAELQSILTGPAILDARQPTSTWQDLGSVEHRVLPVHVIEWGLAGGEPDSRDALLWLLLRETTSAESSSLRAEPPALVFVRANRLRAGAPFAVNAILTKPALAPPRHGWPPYKLASVAQSLQRIGWLHFDPEIVATTSGFVGNASASSSANEVSSTLDAAIAEYANRRKALPMDEFASRSLPEQLSQFNYTPAVYIEKGHVLKVRVLQAFELLSDPYIGADVEVDRTLHADDLANGEVARPLFSCGARREYISVRATRITCGAQPGGWEVIIEPGFVQAVTEFLADGGSYAEWVDVREQFIENLAARERS